MYNGVNLAEVKFNGSNVYKRGNANFKYTLASQRAELNSYASNYYLTVKNERTGTTKNVGGTLGTTNISIPAIDGDIISVRAHGYYEGGYLTPTAPLTQGFSTGKKTFVYPLNDTDITFTASLTIKGYYDGDRGIWLPNEGVRGTVTANYNIAITAYDDEDD
jgi:hypothetical protein